MHPEYNAILSNIRELIRRKGLKQRAVAEKAGFDEHTFSNMLNGRRTLLRVEYLPCIAEAIGVEIKDFYYLPKEETDGIKRRIRKKNTEP